MYIPRRLSTAARRARVGFLAAGLVLLGLGVAAAAEQSGPAPSQENDPKPRPDLVRQPYSEADVDFMAGMIPHHAQAVLIAGWAASHGARPDVRIALRADGRRPARRDRVDAELAARSRPDGARRRRRRTIG